MSDLLVDIRAKRFPAVAKAAPHVALQDVRISVRNVETEEERWQQEEIRNQRAFTGWRQPCVPSWYGLWRGPVCHGLHVNSVSFS